MLSRYPAIVGTGCLTCPPIVELPRSSQLHISRAAPLLYPLLGLTPFRKEQRSLFPTNFLMVLFIVVARFIGDCSCPIHRALGTVSSGDKSPNYKRSSPQLRNSYCVLGLRGRWEQCLAVINHRTTRGRAPNCVTPTVFWVCAIIAILPSPQ